MPHPQNPLTRSSSDMMLAGVCAGIARWLGWDVTLVRVLYVLATIFFMGLPGVIAYVVLMLVMPIDPGEPRP